METCRPFCYDGHMFTEEYKRYIKSERWKRKRQQVFAHYGRRCYACRKRARILHVHHRSYRNLTREPMSDLIPLCQPCHDKITKYHRRNRRRGIEINTAVMIKVIRRQQGTSL